MDEIVSLANTEVWTPIPRVDATLDRRELNHEKLTVIAYIAPSTGERRVRIYTGSLNLSENGRNNHEYQVMIDAPAGSAVGRAYQGYAPSILSRYRRHFTSGSEMLLLEDIANFLKVERGEVPLALARAIGRALSVNNFFWAATLLQAASNAKKSELSHRAVVAKVDQFHALLRWYARVKRANEGWLSRLFAPLLDRLVSGRAIASVHDTHHFLTGEADRVVSTLENGDALLPEASTAAAKGTPIYIRGCRVLLSRVATVRRGSRSLEKSHSRRPS